MRLGYIIVFSALVVTCLCLPHNEQKKEAKAKPGAKKKVLFQLKGKHWNMLGRLLRKYTNLLSNFTAPEHARLFNLNDDYRIDIISDFLFFPSGSNSLVLPALRNARNMGSSSKSKSIPSFTDQLSRLITNQPQDVARLFYSDTTLVPTIEFIFPAPISFPFFNNLFNSRRSFGRQKRDAHQNTQRGRATATGRSAFGISPLYNLGRLDDPKTLNFIYDIPKYLEYADIGRVLEYGFEYLDIQEPDCKMRSVCEAQQFIYERSETVAMVVKSLSSFSSLLDPDMIAALDYGTDRQDCTSIYSTCRSSLLDHVLGLASRMIRERLG